jgi:hypothetical protein
MSIVAAIRLRCPSLGLPVVLIAIALGTTSPPALAGFSAPGACSNTTESANKSCGFDADSTYWLAVGTCRNEPNATRRQACLAAAGNAHDDANQLCGRQHEARNDVCEDLGKAAYHPAIVPSNFVKGITNKYYPLKPGTTLIYRGGNERVVIAVQH